VLGALAAGSTAGCLGDVEAAVRPDNRRPVSVSIKTLPTDADPRAIRIARALSRHLQSVGVRAHVVPMAREELLRSVLLDGSFDLYVARFPGYRDPDFLRPLLHSRYASEPGWQNPFGYENGRVDELLDAQRRQRGKRRRKTLREVQRLVARDLPFTTVAFPDEIRAVRKDGAFTWGDRDLETPLNYLAVRSVGDPEASTANETNWNLSGTETPAAAESAGQTLDVTVSDTRPTENLNPVAPPFRLNDPVTRLLYDSVGRWVDGRVRPWLAESWEWDDESTAATVSLRPDLEWHDGNALTASDVAFTYQLLDDTSLGTAEEPIPAPRFREQSSLVDSVEALDERTVRVEFVPSSRHVARQAFTAPVLPEHVWETRTSLATLEGIQTDRRVTEALVWSNAVPVGSGPLQFERASAEESLLLRRFEDHFLTSEGLDDHLEPFAGGFEPERLRFRVIPSGKVAVSLLADGEADATASEVLPDSVPRIGRTDGLELHVGRSRAFYHVGFNARHAPTSDRRFRRAVTHLLDEGHLVDEVFERYGQPAASPLARHAALAPELAWSDEDPRTPFPGTDGTLDVERARDVFREAGYRYAGDETLVRG
jgi:peptide/nickel transport system substrate-binding protein